MILPYFVEYRKSPSGCEVPQLSPPRGHLACEEERTTSTSWTLLLPQAPSSALPNSYWVMWRRFICTGTGFWVNRDLETGGHVLSLRLHSGICMHDLRAKHKIAGWTAGTEVKIQPHISRVNITLTCFVFDRRHYHHHLHQHTSDLSGVF
jgi:hypothetical protein